jgi:hypothetical protein
MVLSTAPHPGFAKLTDEQRAAFHTLPTEVKERIFSFLDELAKFPYNKPVGELKIEGREVRAFYHEKLIYAVEDAEHAAYENKPKRGIVRETDQVLRKATLARLDVAKREGRWPANDAASNAAYWAFLEFGRGAIERMGQTSRLHQQ